MSGDNRCHRPSECEKCGEESLAQGEGRRDDLKQLRVALDLGVRRQLEGGEQHIWDVAATAAVAQHQAHREGWALV